MAGATRLVCAVRNTLRCRLHRPLSTQAVPQESTFTDPKAEILRAALKHVSTHGYGPRKLADVIPVRTPPLYRRWTQEALAHGSADIGLPAVSHGMFPQGGAHLVEFLMQEGTKAMSEHLQALDMSNMSVNDRIAAGIKARILHMEAVLPVLPQAMATAASTPGHLPAIVHQAGVFADELWFQVGDSSTSMDWYSRRALLVLINFMTELHIVQDTSPAYADTWAFLDRRLADAHSMGKDAFEALSIVSAAAAGVGSVLESGLPLLRPFTSAAVAAPAAAFSAAVTIANGVASNAASGASQAAAAAAPTAPSGFTGASPGDAAWSTAPSDTYTPPTQANPTQDFQQYTPPPPEGDFDLTSGGESSGR